jgi:hypothetical protein
MKKTFPLTAALLLFSCASFLFAQSLLPSDPTSPFPGQSWYNTTLHVWKYYDGTSAISAKTAVSIVASLPTCNSAAEGTHYGVTNALAPTSLSAVAGGGSVHVPVYCNGINWIVE